MTTDSGQPSDERQYHLQVSDGDVAETVLLPGDPGRIEKITQFWDDTQPVAHKREYRTVTGTYAGTPLSVTSTGIGSPSAAIAVEELARVGGETFIRVGSCGGIQPQLAVGDLVITSGAVRQEGTSDEYVRQDYPAVADAEVVDALIAAAEYLDHEYHVGPTMSADSFYAGQGRAGYNGYESSSVETLIEDLQAANVLNIEMEAAAICTLGSLYGLRSGAICTVYANRETGEFRTEGEAAAAETATLAAKILAEMDKRKAGAGAAHWHAGLGIDVEELLSN